MAANALCECANKWLFCVSFLRFSTGCVAKFDKIGRWPQRPCTDVKMVTGKCWAGLSQLEIWALASIAKEESWTLLWVRSVLVKHAYFIQEVKSKGDQLIYLCCEETVKPDNHRCDRTGLRDLERGRCMQDASWLGVTTARNGNSVDRHQQ